MAISARIAVSTYTGCTGCTSVLAHLGFDTTVTRRTNTNTLLKSWVSISCNFSKFLCAAFQPTCFWHSLPLYVTGWQLKYQDWSYQSVPATLPAFWHCPLPHHSSEAELQKTLATPANAIVPYLDRKQSITLFTPNILETLHTNKDCFNVSN